MHKVLSLAVALLACTLSASQAAEPARMSAPRWLVAEVAVCELDGRKVPHRSEVCREGTVRFCNARGSWEDTRKPC